MREQDGEDLGVWSEFGSAAEPGDGGAGGGEVRSGLGSRPDLDGLPAVTGLGDAPSAGGAIGSALGEAALLAGAKVGEATVPPGYRNRVDADGDGDLDKATYRGRADGGADILVDLNRDGRADFVGHDVDLDNRVDYADYDKDHDGVFEKRMYDDDGDGYLDRSVWNADS